MRRVKAIRLVYRTARAWLWILGTVVVGALLATPASAQDDLRGQRQETQQRLDNLKEQIQRDQNRLQETIQTEQTTQKKLESLEREIALREELVSTYQDRLDQLETERSALRDTLSHLQTEMEDLQEEYHARVRHAYKYNRIPDLALVLAARSINQMLVRIRYLQRFAQQRQRRRSDMRLAAEQVRESQDQLQEKQTETQELLAEARRERKNLQSLKSDRQAVIKELRSRRSDLQDEIDEKQAQARQLEQQIRALIAKLERREAERSEAERAERAAESADLSAAFRENKGQLPWPTEGAITEEFGNRVDPVHGTQTYHPGILIATNPEQNVQAVFEGTVSGIDFVPGYGTYLVVRHGDYLSVYSNFSHLYVNEGDPVEAGDVLGRAGTDEEPRGAGLFFAVFDRSESTSVDPTSWLSAR